MMDESDENARHVCPELYCTYQQRNSQGENLWL